MISSWSDLFPPHSIPEWLEDFDREPDVAVDELLRARYYFGHLNVADPEDLLIDWLSTLDDQSRFRERIDEALARWVIRAWGRPAGSDAGRARELSAAWSRLADIVAYSESLDKTASELRSRFDDRNAYLGPLSLGPSRDPLGRYLFAIAHYQSDRTLSSAWEEIVELPAQVPFYHGVYGVAGLRGLPPSSDSERGGFRQEVATGLLKLGSSLHRLASDRLLPYQRAKEEFLRVLVLTVSAYPFPSRWSRAMNAQRRSVSETVLNWVAEVVTVANQAVTEIYEPDPMWANRAKAIAASLSTHTVDSVDHALTLLAEQRAFTQSTGVSYFLTRSLCNFAAVVRETQPGLALQWADEALKLEPTNPYTWTTFTQAALANQEVERAYQVASEALERFPENPYSWTGLAAALVTKGLLYEAEALSREATERFENNPYMWTALGEVFRTSGRLQESTRVFTEAKERFPENRVIQVGLAQVEMQARREVELVKRRAWSPAEHVVGPSVTRAQAGAAIGYVRFLRRWARHNEGSGDSPRAPHIRKHAMKLLDDVAKYRSYDARAASEKGLLLLDARQTSEADEFLTDAFAKLPGSPGLAYALARVERVQAASKGSESATRDRIVVRWHHLSEISLNLRPLGLLGEGRSWLDLRDGHEARHQASRALRTLHHWTWRFIPTRDVPTSNLRDFTVAPESVRKFMIPSEAQTLLETQAPSSDAAFEMWWSLEIQSYVFGLLTPSEPDEALYSAVIKERLDKYGSYVDDLEEYYTNRLAV